MNPSLVGVRGAKRGLSVTLGDFGEMFPTPFIIHKHSTVLFLALFSFSVRKELE